MISFAAFLPQLVVPALKDSQAIILWEIALSQTIQLVLELVLVPHNQPTMHVSQGIHHMLSQVEMGVNDTISTVSLYICFGIWGQMYMKSWLKFLINSTCMFKLIKSSENSYHLLPHREIQLPIQIYYIRARSYQVHHQSSHLTTVANVL